MNFIGDIERLVADLWPFRVPIAIVLIVSLAIFGYIAWRRGWYRVATSRPRLSLGVVLLVLVIGGPIAWVLGSPLFIRTELQEEVPVAAAGTATTALLEGTFQGADELHFGSGQARLIEIAPGELVLSLEDFSVLNGPDLFVYLSPDPNGWTADSVLLGDLKATDGSFSYEVPRDIDLADVASVVIWCRAFSVLFATATLEAGSA
ncbi:MAG: DM13 domain-containing protein [Chloroflexota bacterium]